MATVTLDRCWLSLASSPSTSTGFWTTARTDSRVTAGQVRRYANGRDRVITQAGTSTTLGVTARNLTPAQVALIDSWRGAVVLFRDLWGRKLYCTFFTVTVMDYQDRGGQDVALSLTQVSFSEAV